MKLLNLAKSQLISLQHQALTIEILSGEVWLTKNGDTKDYCLSPADGVTTIPMNSNIVIEALQDSLLCIVDHFADYHSARSSYSGQETEARTALHFSKERSTDEAESTLPASAR